MKRRGWRTLGTGGGPSGKVSAFGLGAMRSPIVLTSDMRFWILRLLIRLKDLSAAELSTEAPTSRWMNESAKPLFKKPWRQKIENSAIAKKQLQICRHLCFNPRYIENTRNGGLVHVPSSCVFVAFGIALRGMQSISTRVATSMHCRCHFYYATHRIFCRFIWTTKDWCV